MKKNLKIMIVALMVIPCIFFLIACERDGEQEYEFASRTKFEYVNNTSSDSKFIQLGGSGGYGGEYWHNYTINGNINRYTAFFEYKMSGQNITITFAGVNKGLPDINGTFNDDWTEVVFNDTFPLSDSVGWRFVARA